jgi:3-oxoacyl-[acyl-carrier-protein] synthase-1
MPDVFVVSDNILSPLGLTTAKNFEQLTRKATGIKEHDDTNMSSRPFYASLFAKKNCLIKDSIESIYTKFEQLLIASVSNALENSGIDASDKKTILIISSTKGNISLLETETHNLALQKRIALHTSAKLVAEYFRFVNQPVVVSNACISGLLAILVGMRMIQSAQYENAVITGADVISKFVLSGFQSFQAISDEPCKPFDQARSGISLGEGAGTLILSSLKKYAGEIKVMGGSVNNDANHISGPSRTGEELAGVINKTLQEANIPASEIDFISAHGTATLYNDEMEAKAITIADLQSVPVNSLKGYYGHTLGAAGLIESIISIHSIKENLVLPTMGFKQPGFTKPLNICSSLLHGSLQNCLKTASGFGGCNAAVVFGKSGNILN